MKWWRSRSILGIVIGILNILIYIGLIITMIIGLVYINLILKTNSEAKKQIFFMNLVFGVLIVICLIMIIIPGFLIAGIIKKRHNYMLPWLILQGIFLAANCYRLLFFIDIVDVLATVILALTLWHISTLYRDVRKINIEGPEQELGAF